MDNIDKISLDSDFTSGNSSLTLTKIICIITMSIWRIDWKN